MDSSKVRLVECPRDAMQGWKTLIGTREKANYINALLKVGFHTIDFGSFVSAKAIPQMADTPELLDLLDLSGSNSKLLAIIANVRGAVEACSFPQIDQIGFPFSVSETFQQRNANSSIETAFERLQEIRNISAANNKGLVVYLSMGFGNHYGDPYSEAIVLHWAERISRLDVELISIADTIGVARPESISKLSAGLISEIGEDKFGLHLHSRPDNWKEKIEAAWNAGCRRFDGALMGIGGCPMADDELTGNMNMENMISYFSSIQALPDLNYGALENCLEIAAGLFSGNGRTH